jgi:hypothetical protein
MVKEITNIFINSKIAVDNGNVDRRLVSSAPDVYRIYSVYMDVPPIIIRNRANLKVANICHSGSGHGDNIILFKLDGIMTDNNKYLSNDGGIPTIIATNFNNTRNLYEENDIPLIRQTINTIRLFISDSLTNPNAGILDTLNFCISLKIEEEINE